MAARDGQDAFNTLKWGLGNRELHGLLAVLVSGTTHAAAIRSKLDLGLAMIKGSHEYAIQAFCTGRDAAHATQKAVISAMARRRALTRKLHEHGLEEPTRRWAVMAFLALLIIGDLTMTSVAMAVFNLSDHPYVRWLPVSDLQLAAVPVVVGMFGAAHWLGESLVAFHPTRQLRLVVTIVLVTSVGGGVALALSVAVIRSSYLSANGVAALPGPFIGIQMGLLLIAVAASAWTAHPYGAAWREIRRQERRAIRGYLRARKRAGKQAAAANGLVHEHQAQVAAARSGMEAVLSDPKRQGHLYIRELQHAQPEPTEEELYPGALPEIEVSYGAGELLEYPDVPPSSNLASPELASLDDLDASWHDLWQRNAAEAGPEIVGTDEEPGGTVPPLHAVPLIEQPSKPTTGSDDPTPGAA